MLGAKLSFCHFHKNISHPHTLHKYFKIYRRWLVIGVKESQETKSNKFQDDLKKKILYNEILHFQTKKKEKKEKKVKPTYTSPIFLKYLEDKQEVSEPEVTVDDDNIHLPFEVNKKFVKEPFLDKPVTEDFKETLNDLTPSDNIQLPDFSIQNLEFENLKKCEDNEDYVINDSIDENIKYGTCDPNTPVSSVPCGGCGAKLHCCSPSIPGFLPQEVFKGKKDKELRSEICQRCHFLKEFDLALGVNVSPSEYTTIIGSLKDKRALPIVIIDMMDFPCSINPEIFKLLGTKNFFVVGNKVDLFIREGTWTLKQLETSLIDSLESQGVNMKNIWHLGLISAKTGYGIEELINKIYKFWAFKGDLYLIGCTNAGKSTLFNTLINSDLCKVQAMNIMHKATISTWPGTTLNLLKFPITSPSGFRMYQRTLRLKKRIFSENSIAQQKLLKTLNVRKEQIPLSAVIERTDFSKNKNKDTVPSTNFYAADLSLKEQRLPGINPDEPPFNQSKWCHDTPGVVFEDQIINLLTTPELLLTIPRKMLLPRNFHLHLGSSLFIGGLARLDFIKGPDMAWFTVYASSDLPITITKTEDASHVYEELLGSEYFRVPSGGEARFKKWPGLSSKKLEVASKSSKEAAVDIVLSNAGWVSVTVESAYRCILEAWTPQKKGIHVREIPVIKFGHIFRGPRILKTPAFKTEVKEVPAEIISDYLDYIKLHMKKKD